MEWKDVPDCLQLRTGRLRGAAWCLGWDVQSLTHLEDKICHKGLLPGDSLSQKAPPCIDHLDTLALSGLCHGPALWALCSEVLTVESHTCRFEGVSGQTSDKPWQLPVFSHGNSYNQHVTQWRGGCSFFQTKVWEGVISHGIGTFELRDGFSCTNKMPIDILLSKLLPHATSKPWAVIESLPPNCSSLH